MYVEDQTTVSAELAEASSEVFSESTIESILALISTTEDPEITIDNLSAANNAVINPDDETELLFVDLTGTTPTTVTVTGDTEVIVFQGGGGVEATFNSVAPAAARVEGEIILGAGPQAAEGDEMFERVIVGTAQADEITILDDVATKVIAGDGDTILAGDGHTVVVAAQGSSTVFGGADTMLQAVGQDTDFTVTAGDGSVMIANATTGVEVEISNAQYVMLDDGDALIFAANEAEAAVANLYQAVLGRAADAEGLDFWFGALQQDQTVDAIAQGFLNSTEYGNPDLDNTEFIAELYQNALGRTADTSGAAFWVAALESGASRAGVVAEFARVAANHEELNEPGVVGSVTIVDNIIS
ncbi:DUF4214 domain-containing protein [Pseudoduganella sp. SL102]|uniref:DUF4214 domain-containing protein n=1 Tax=Pseudoduganella sp. SL102 TaxID=2995154 RepID=UPI00248B832D|nr:DUF4214 domain-containing protein [Pseudoduganella sp. SL102]WBS04673.1 DUF4214 domain-containing protein [Pseudoduganella sp. SL102]